MFISTLNAFLSTINGLEILLVDGALWPFKGYLEAKQPRLQVLDLSRQTSVLREVSTFLVFVEGT